MRDFLDFSDFAVDFCEIVDKQRLLNPEPPLDLGLAERVDLTDLVLLRLDYSSTSTTLFLDSLLLVTFLVSEDNPNLLIGLVIES